MIKAGFAERNVTPPDGTERAGAYTKAYLKGVRDPLKTRVAVFEEDGEKAAIVALDTCVVFERTARMIKEKIRDKAGVRPEKILVAASHTHSGATLWGFREDELKDAPELVRKIALEWSPSLSEVFERIVVEKSAEAAAEAVSKMDAESFSLGVGKEKEFVFNRRVRMKSGRAFTHPGKGNPDNVDFAGPVDPDVGVLGAWRKDGKLAGCVVNYACHCTAWSQTVASADYVCALEKIIKNTFGSGAVVVFLNGACGDVTQVDNIGTRANHSSEEWLNIIGTRVGAEAVKVLVSAEKGALETLAVINDSIPVKRRAPSKDKTEKSAALAGKAASDPDMRNNEEWIWAKERVMADYVAKKEPVKNVLVQAFQVGPLVILANPAEYFCRFGLDIKARSKFPVTFVSELSNDCVGYVPTEDAFGKNGGGYETILTGYSNLEPSAGTKIADACVMLSEKLKPGKLPEGPKISAPGQPWLYGVRGPDLD